MTATYAQETKVQGGPKVQRVALSKGDMAGHLEVLEDSIAINPSVRIRCTTSGVEFELSAKVILKHRDRNTKTCIKCSPRKVKVYKGKYKNCIACSDCPALRPINGKCPACGEPGNSRDR